MDGPGQVMVHPLVLLASALSGFAVVGVVLVRLRLTWLLVVFLLPVLGCLLFGKAIDAGLKAGQDLPLVQLAGAEAVETSLLVCRSFVTGLRIVDTLCSTWAKEREEMQLEETPISKGGVCFLGDSEFNFWHHLRSDMDSLMPHSPLSVGNSSTAVPPVEGCFNAGFGGSRTIDLLWYAQPLCLKHQPRAVVLHNGGGSHMHMTGLHTGSRCIAAPHTHVRVR